MSNQKITTKKLKAIVFTDIVNFTSISAKDEQVALDLIQKQNEIIKKSQTIGFGGYGLFI